MPHKCRCEICQREMGLGLNELQVQLDTLGPAQEEINRLTAEIRQKDEMVKQWKALAHDAESIFGEVANENWHEVTEWRHTYRMYCDDGAAWVKCESCGGENTEIWSINPIVYCCKNCGFESDTAASDSQRSEVQ